MSHISTYTYLITYVLERCLMIPPLGQLKPIIAQGMEAPDAAVSYVLHLEIGLNSS